MGTRTSCHLRVSKHRTAIWSHFRIRRTNSSSSFRPVPPSALRFELPALRTAFATYSNHSHWHSTHDHRFRLQTWTLPRQDPSAVHCFPHLEYRFVLHPQSEEDSTSATTRQAVSDMEPTVKQPEQTDIHAPDQMGASETHSATAFRRVPGQSLVASAGQSCAEIPHDAVPVTAIDSRVNREQHQHKLIAKHVLHLHAFVQVARPLTGFYPRIADRT